MEKLSKLSSFKALLRRSVTARMQQISIVTQVPLIPGSGVQDTIQNELEAKKVTVAGYDKLGRRILVLKVNRHVRTKRDLAEMIRFLCYGLDKGIKLADLEKNPSGKLVGIFDLQGDSPNLQYV